MLRRARRAPPLLAMALSAVAASGCGGQGTASRSASSTATSGRSASTTTARSAVPARRRPRRLLPPIGRTQTVHASGSTLSVTVTRILDPLSGSGATLVAGTRPVSVQLTIRVDAGATYDSTASGDWMLVTSAGAAAPLFIPQGVCATPLTDFESLISAGEDRSGCVGFAAARGARIVAIRFLPHSRPAGSVSWR
jgi:hypothetical protein